MNAAEPATAVAPALVTLAALAVQRYRADVDLGRHPAAERLPVVNVVALVLIIISVVPVYIAQRLASVVTSGAGL